MFDLIAALPAPETLPPMLSPQQLEGYHKLGERFSMESAYRRLRIETQGMSLLMLYQQYFPKQWAESTASLSHSHGRRAGCFSERELEFFRLLATIIPLYDDYYLDMDQETRSYYIPMCYQFQGIDPDEFEDSGHPGQWLQLALSRALVSPKLWDQYLNTFDLNWRTHGPKFLKHHTDYHSVVYDFKTIVRGMRRLDPVWEKLPAAWTYASSNCISKLFNYSEEQTEDGGPMPELNEDEVAAAVAVTRICRPQQQAYYDLGDRLEKHPAEAKRLIELVDAHAHTSLLPPQNNPEWCGYPVPPPLRLEAPLVESLPYQEQMQQYRKWDSEHQLRPLRYPDEGRVHILDRHGRGAQEERDDLFEQLGLFN